MSNSSDLSNHPSDITVSIVSHGHGRQVERLVEQVLRDPSVGRLILTLNIEEDLSLANDYKIVKIQNQTPKGFGANHNAAFKRCKTPFFCVLNPDIVLSDSTFEQLRACLIGTKAAVAGPLVLAASGDQEDSWRKFPTILSLGMKSIGHDTTVIKSIDQESPLFPDWIAGMCMLFDADQYRAVNGFDETIFLYYEDVDICARLWQKGSPVVASPSARVVHNAQRASRRQWQHMKWHACSMARYFKKYTFRTPKTDKKSINER